MDTRVSWRCESHSCEKHYRFSKAWTETSNACFMQDVAIRSIVCLATWVIMCGVYIGTFGLEAVRVHDLGWRGWRNEFYMWQPLNVTCDDRTVRGTEKLTVISWSRTSRFIYKHQVHYLAFRSLSLNLILSQLNPIRLLIIYKNFFVIEWGFFSEFLSFKTQQPTRWPHRVRRGLSGLVHLIACSNSVQSVDIFP
jgi:hypothetical protein